MPLPGVDPRTPPARPRAALVAGAGAVLTALSVACSDPVEPRPKVQYTATKLVAEPQTRPYYTDSLLSFQQRVFYWTDRVDWAAQGASVRADVAAATTYGDVWRAAAASVDRLRTAPPTGRDNHSAYFPPAVSPGITDAPPDPRNLASGVALPGAAGQPGLAYVWLPGFTGRNLDGRADSIQTVIRTLDAANPCGWVLDLRRNLGGYTDAMMAGLNPLVGDAPAGATQSGYGGEVDRTGARVLWYLERGRSGIYDAEQRRKYEPFAQASNPYTLRRPASPVALLVGPNTASAAEAITIAFRGAAVPSRSFGTATYGLTTGPLGRYLLPDSGFLNITASLMFDRTGRLYGDKLQPDELVAGGPGYNTLTPTPSASDPVIAAAAAWLRQQTACGGTGPASARLRASRAPVTPDALPGAALPLAPEFRVPRVFAAPAPAAARR